ncbi:MAG: DUF5060 domain-containing protein, partial [Bacteroidetes bacterium]
MKKLLLILVLGTAGITLAFSRPEIRRISQFTDTIGIYEKLELGVELAADFENPFDPDQLDITATFLSPAGKQARVPGFYIQSRRTPFAIRFSPGEKGTWSYTVTVRDHEGETTSPPATFTVTDSPHHGPLRIASNRRYLQHADGTPWYGVGLWYNGTTDTDVLDELDRLGVNFISRLIAPLETWATGLGRYDQEACGDIDELLEELEERDMQLALNFWFHSFLSETVWGGGNIAWHRHPYRLACDARDFFSSGEAWKYQEKLYRYMIARWGYSRSLAIWFVVDEVNGTDGWAMGDSLAASVWAGRVHDYFKKNDPWQHLTTGTRSGGIDEWWDRGYEVFDMAGREIYEAQGFPINTTGRIDRDGI